MQKAFFSLMCFLPLWAIAQFSDDFSNGNFTQDPPWTGNHEKFVVEQGMLRLSAEGAGFAWLSTPSHVIRDTQWDFWLRMAFTPSDNNHPRVYLVSDRPDLSGKLQGYYLQMGKTGADNKRLYFYRQDGESVKMLLEGSMNLASGTNNRVRVRVTRDAIGNWSFAADPGGGQLFIPQGTVQDDTFNSTGWFGISCTYTASNSRRFYFDDFRVGDILPGTPPEVKRISVESAGSLDVHFNQVLDAAGAGLVNNYLVDGGMGFPLVASLDPERPWMVRLLFGRHFRENQLYTLSVSGVRNPDGQVMHDYSGTFVHYVSNRFDVVFNELMVNSRPVVQLPPHDWLELYNTTHLPVSLKGWALHYGNSSQILPEAVIPARGYLVLTSEAAYPSMKALFPDNPGLVLAVPGFGVNALPAGGALLVLYDADGKLISHVNYSGSWYRDPSKAGGGWSLEKIDPYNFCQGAENWSASVDVSGGTPGFPNAVLANNPDHSVPEMLRAAFVDDQAILLYFDQPMDDVALGEASHYLISDGVGNPLSAQPQGPDFSSVLLTLAVPLSEGVTYRVEASEKLTGCSGNALGNRVARVGVPLPAAASDLVINEVLFNPPQGGARYIELFNRSKKILDMKDFLISSRDTLSGLLTEVQLVSEESFLVFPGDYVVLSNEVKAVWQTFFMQNPEAFLEVSRLPGMTNRGGLVVLASRGQEIIDQVTLSEEMHLPLLFDLRGVALERIHPDRPSADCHNWHSGAESTGFGTPGYRNAQHAVTLNGSSPSFELSAPVFSPDGSGGDDVVQILYRIKEPGYVANVLVFDRMGREVKHLVRGKVMATEGAFTWNGTTNGGQRAARGVYVVFLEVFNAHGQVHTTKLPVVLATRF